jgi:hypothetical protein
MKRSLFKELTKGEIRASALKELRYRRCTVWPQNNLAVRGRKFIGRKGVADVIGFNTQGVFVACEIKTVGDVLSQDQIEFLNDVKSNGGVAIIAKQSTTGAVLLEPW